MKRTILVAMLLLIAISAVALADGMQTFAICFEPSEGEFQDLNLPDMIYGKIVGFPKVGIATPARTESALKEHSRLVSKYFEPELMTDLAEAMGVRYVVYVKVEEAGTRKSAHTFLPYVFRSQHRKYVLGVRMYVVDSFDGETIVSQYFESEKKGPAVMSCLDYDEHDPGLVQRFSVVKGKFVEMEDEISDQIANEIIKVAQSR